MSKAKQSLTIVIPAYNEQGVITKCLDSIDSQSEKPNEVLVVDNNSTDNTVMIAKRYSFVRVISESQQGIAYAHKAGFDTASSNFIARIDADSILPDNWVETVKNYFENPKKHDTTLTGSGFAHNLKAQKLSGRLIDSGFIFGWLGLGHYPLWGPNLVIPRVVWAKISENVCFQDDIFDDLDVSLHIHSLGLPIVWNRKLRVMVRVSNLDSYPNFFKYTQRWPRTLKNHGMKRWLIVAVLLSIVATLQYPMFKFIKK